MELSFGCDGPVHVRDADRSTNQGFHQSQEECRPVLGSHAVNGEYNFCHREKNAHSGSARHFVAFITQAALT